MYTVEEGLNSFVLTKGAGSLGINEMKELLNKLKGKVNYLTIPYKHFVNPMKKREIKIGKRTKKINIEVSPDLMEAFVMAIEKAKVEVIVEELSGEGIKSPVALKRFTSNSN